MSATPSGEQFELRFGEQHAIVTEVGAGLRAYSAGGRELLDGYPADDWQAGAAASSCSPGRTAFATARTGSAGESTGWR